MLLTPPTEPQWQLTASLPLQGATGVKSQTLAINSTTAQRWRLHVTSTFSSYQSVVSELRFCHNGLCLGNNTRYVVGASGSRPDPSFGGDCTQAMDGNVSSVWDSVPDAQGTWLLLDFGKPVTVSSVQLDQLGDGTHDMKTSVLEAFAQVMLPQDINISLHYDIYEGLPVIAKSMALNSGLSPITISAVVVENLGLNYPFGAFEATGPRSPGSVYTGEALAAVPFPQLRLKTDRAHSAACSYSNDYPNSYDPNAGMGDQGSVEPDVRCSYYDGFALIVPAQSNWTSFKVFALALDSGEVERSQLAMQRTTMILAPHSQVGCKVELACMINAD